jgi:hypothetical protein
MNPGLSACVSETYGIDRAQPRYAVNTQPPPSQYVMPAVKFSLAGLNEAGWMRLGPDTPSKAVLGSLAAPCDGSPFKTIS